MRAKRWLLVGWLASLLLLSGSAAVVSPSPAADNCYTIVVGRNASADGSVIIAHNEDDAGEMIVNLRKIRPRDYGSPQRIALGKGAVYETDGKTLGFLWIEATKQEFADSFINQAGVLVTSDSCPSNETRDDVTDGGIGYMLRRLIAEKAGSAKEAIKIAAALVEKYGYTGSGRTYTIADKNEAWMMAIIKGRHWYAQRIPDDEVAIIPNHYTIRTINPDDASRFMGSPDIVDYARKNGWYDAAKDGPFDFKKAFSKVFTADLTLDRNTLRHWRGLNLLSGRGWEINDAYPFSFKPAKKVSAESLMGILRDHYEGTEYDVSDGYKNGSPNRMKYRSICTGTTINSFIASLSAARPEPISIFLWIALGKPDTTAYMPLYYGVDSLPPGSGLGADIHDYTDFYARHFDDAEWQPQKGGLLNNKVFLLQKIAEEDYAKMRPEIDADLRPAEKEFVENRGKIESDFADLYAKNEKEALRKLTAYVAAAFARIGEITSGILAKHPR